MLKITQKYQIINKSKSEKKRKKVIYIHMYMQERHNGDCTVTKGELWRKLHTPIVPRCCIRLKAEVKETTEITKHSHRADVPKQVLSQNILHDKTHYFKSTE